MLGFLPMGGAPLSTVDDAGLPGVEAPGFIEIDEASAAFLILAELVAIDLEEIE